MIRGSTFDEARVLQELEQLQLAIRATRAQRERVQAEFDAQLRAFEPPSLSPTGPSEPSSMVTGLTGPTVSAKRADAPRPLESSRSEPALDRAAAIEPPQVTEGGAMPVDRLPPSRSSARLLGIVGGVVLVGSIGLVWVFNRAPSATTPPVVQHPSRPTPSVPPLPEVSKPAAPPVDPHLLRIDLTTLRRVWLRVAVDGRIAIEREVAAGEQLPFGADRSIVVRAGDAGAVTVRVGGVDQGPIGRDGEVLTRTFTAPAR
jgi:hypothetical protein